ncbi:MAG: hypothetical protein ABIL58_18280 [Pseudomonadota bacterium]
MDLSYQRMRAAARRLAAGLPAPAFYRVFQHQYARSRQFFETDTVVRRLYLQVLDMVASTMGHGIGHATAVSVDAGCLALIEAPPLTISATSTTLLRLVQSAGLLHDICRNERDHAAAGAAAAEILLADYPFSDNEIQCICDAIRCHVAFQPLPVPADPITELIGNCLYDADKFRWGPDNFTHTVWDMLDEAAITPLAFAERYDNGIRYVKTVATTFRTASGRQYGPEFIDIGLIIARRLKPFIDAETQGANDR